MAALFHRFGSKSETVSNLQTSALYALVAPSTEPEVRNEAIEMAKKGKKVASKG
jgi:hypothetical protein